MDPITISGNFFYAGSSRWAPKGLCYQVTDDVDPISDDNYDTINALVSEGGKWANLNINALRVYQVEPDKSHDKVMALLASKGIHVMIGLVNTQIAMPRNGGYPCAVLERCKAVIDAFAGYDNVFAFSAANEVLNGNGMQSTAAAVKALVRDCKAYAATKDRTIPVGLAMRDVRGYTWPAAKYYTCGPVADRVDFIAYNVYVWCAPESATDFTGQIDAYGKLYEFFEEFPVPVFWGENGCMNSGKRMWKQVPYLFGQKEIYRAPNPGTKWNMADVIQGGFAFRYIMRNENKGLVDSSGNDEPDGGIDQLGAEYAAITAFGGTNPGTGNSGDAKDCSTWADSSFNPDMPAGCDQGGNVPTTGTNVTFTNEITPAQTVKLLIHLAGEDENTWHTMCTIDPGGSSKETYIPTGTDKVMMIFGADGWPMGCQITDMSSITEGCTIHGAWSGSDGTGTCPVS